MGSCAEMLASSKNYSREAQDKYAIRSYKRAQDAINKGFFSDEIISIDDGELITTDEEPRKAKFEKIPVIRSAFEKDGTITAANASKLNDGAAAVVLMSEKKMK